MPAPLPAPAARQTARRETAGPRLPAGAPGSAGWLPPARPAGLLPGRCTAAGWTSGPPPSATATIWPRPPAGRRSPPRASAPAAPPRARAARPTAAPACRPGNRSPRAGRGTTAAVPPPALPPGLPIAESPATRRAVVPAGPRPAGVPRRPGRSWWCPGRFQSRTWLRESLVFGSFNFDFGGRQDVDVLLARQGRQVGLTGAPPLMPQRSPGRLAGGYVADKLDQVGVGGRRLGVGAFHAVDDRLRVHVPLERVAALVVQFPHGR